MLSYWTQIGTLSELLCLMQVIIPVNLNIILIIFSFFCILFTIWRQVLMHTSVSFIIKIKLLLWVNYKIILVCNINNVNLIIILIWINNHALIFIFSFSAIVSSTFEVLREIAAANNPVKLFLCSFYCIIWLI